MPTVLVPVYNAPEALAACLASLDRCCAPDQPMIMLDDASTDRRVASLLESFCDRPARQLLTNQVNEGFVETANRGFDATQDSVVLLNSDTIVTLGWLEAIERCARSDRHIATATPFSNNAEICSFPRFCEASPVPRDPNLVAAAIARIGRPRYPRLPTAVGFCMYIRRQVLDEIGPFDAETFGRGYGEENDFCMRALAAGYHHVLCDDAYVVHLGGASFAATGLKPGGSAMARLLRKHPDYERRVHEFIGSDPISERRAEILAAMSADERRALEPSAAANVETERR